MKTREQIKEEIRMLERENTYRGECGLRLNQITIMKIKLLQWVLEDEKDES